ncbi:phage tail protein [Salmonella enterica subsp. enterica serovar Napoli]|nr:phage tail protein [Salmonella enterica subsp. enterica serovar Napoli]ECY8074988.1 phage tail protein [Salmonella enterica subsp. enterica serovar Vitkin]EEJ3410315.1 phage tail protein [Salmonella enterica subsp. enterica]EEN5245384.1 phage tail protein [Salmonella enterica subsp. enterica serovar Enteritidis]EJU3850167.1 phage tail protein [Salmonella enterica]
MPVFPKFKTIITDYGKQRLIAAMSPGGTKLTLTQMAVGDGGGNPTNPDTTSTTLVNEVWRAAVNSVTVDKSHQNTIIVELLIPAEVGGFWVREAGIYDEFNKLVAICSLPASEKPLLEQGSGRAQTVRMTLVISDLSTINITIDSTTIIATNDYVDNSLKEHEKSRNHPDATLTDKGFVQLSSATGSTDETKAATPKAVKAAMDNANKRQPGNENLTALSSLAGQPDKLPYFTNKGAMSLAEFAEFMRTMLSKTDAASVLEYLGLRETINLAAGALQKDQNGGDIPDKGLFTQNISAALAFSGGIHIGGDSNPWTTAEFIAWLESCGAFNHPYWMCKGSWDYAGNKVITDTGCGNVCLAGAVVEIMGTGGAITIRVTTPTTTSGGGVASAQFTYINHGDGYAPGWRRDFNTINKPTAGDVGALPVTGGRLNGPLGIGTDNAPGGNSLVLGDNDTGFKQDGDGVLDVYSNYTHVLRIIGNLVESMVSLKVNGNAVATGEVQAGNGASRMAGNGDIFGSVWGNNWLSLWINNNFVADVQLGAGTSVATWNNAGSWPNTPGYVVTSVWKDYHGENIDGINYAPLQKRVGNQWYTVQGGTV